MAERPPKEEIDKWHRWFAIECNNAAWPLSEAPSRTQEQNAEMLQRAYAAAFHWFQIGTDVNKNRAESLLAQVHAVLGHGDLAMHYAKRNHDFVFAAKSDDWEIAFAHAIFANAAHAAGDAALHASQYAQALQVAERLSDPKDSEIFTATLSTIPKP